MSYYKDQLTAYIDLDKSLEMIVERKINLNINTLLYEMTKVHAVSSKNLRKRVEEFAESKGFKIVNNILRMND
jgi:hypothetical protein